MPTLIFGYFRTLTRANYLSLSTIHLSSVTGDQVCASAGRLVSVP